MGKAGPQRAGDPSAQPAAPPPPCGREQRHRVARRHHRGSGHCPHPPLFLPWSRGSYGSCREGRLPQTAPRLRPDGLWQQHYQRKGTGTRTVPPPGGSLELSEASSSLESQRPREGCRQDFMKPVSLTLLATLHHRRHEPGEPGWASAGSASRSQAGPAGGQASAMPPGLDSSGGALGPLRGPGPRGAGRRAMGLARCLPQPGRRLQLLAPVPTTPVSYGPGPLASAPGML